MRFVARVLPLVLLLAVASAADAKRPKWTWASLHRPLNVPTIAAGSPCPVSTSHAVDLGPGEGFRTLPGRGPAYPAGLAPDVALEFVYPPDPRQVDFYGSGWGGNKVLWWVTRDYKGPVLIRGRQLDGLHVVRFDTGTPPRAEIRIPPWTTPYYRTHSRGRGSYTRVEAPGCYAYQIDGVGFSRTIVFRARLVPAP